VKNTGALSDKSSPGRNGNSSGFLILRFRFGSGIIAKFTVKNTVKKRVFWKMKML
jgi:hypothetical protein